MIPAVIFSRNRAMQLDALLDSLATNAPGEFEPYVLFRADTFEYDKAYSRLQYIQPAEWIREVNFADQLTRLIADVEGPVAFYVDDDILYRPIPGVPDMRELWAEHWACFSLRLGTNTTYCYPHQRDQRVPGSGNAPMMSWPWREYEGDFSYPASLDGGIFQSDLIRAFLQMTHPDPRFDKMSNPNQFEDYLASRFVAFHKPAMMASFAHSALVGIPANRVTETHVANRVMESHTTEELNGMFLDGYRIAWRDMDYSQVNAAHCEIPYVFTKEPTP